jgi:hypothetical protein
VVHGRVVDLQGRAYPTPARRSAYLNRPGAIRNEYNAGDAGQRSVVLCEGIPDTLSILAAGLKDTGACGLYGTGGRQPAWLPLFRRASRVYVALDRDAIERGIALARTFGTRGRVLIPPEDLGPKGDLGHPGMSPHGTDLGQTIEQPEIVYEKGKKIDTIFVESAGADLGVCFYALESIPEAELLRGHRVAYATDSGA